MKILMFSYLLLTWSLSVLGSELYNESVAHLYKKGFILKATVKSNSRISFDKETTLIKVSHDKFNDRLKLGCYLHLKDKPSKDINLDSNEAIIFDGAQSLNKEYGQRGRYLHMEFLTSSGHEVIGGIRIGEKDLHHFLWYDSTYSKSVNELNRLCSRLKIEVVPKTYVINK